MHRGERGRRYAGWLSCGLVGLVGSVASCGGFGSGPASDGAPPVGAPDTGVPLVPDGVEAGRVETGAPDGSDASSCAATSAGKFDLSFGGAGGRLLPVTQPVAALGPPGRLYVAGVEPCGAGQTRGISVRSVPLDGSSEGTVLRCFDAEEDRDTPVSLHGDPASGYVLAARYYQGGYYRGRLRFLLGTGAERAPLFNAGSGTWPSFAVRAQATSGPPLDIWGYFTAIASTYSNPFVGVPQGRAAPAQPGELPIAAATYGTNLVVAYVRQVDEGASSMLVVRRFVVGAAGIGADPSLGKQEVPILYAPPDSISSPRLYADERGIVVAIAQGQSLFPIRIEPAGPRALPPVIGLGSPHVTRRCDGTLAMAYVENGGTVVVTRYKNDAPDPAFRATIAGTSSPAFLVRAPDESLLVGVPSAGGTTIRRVLP